MAFAFQKTYTPELERLLYHLPEPVRKDRRRFAALEAINWGMEASAHREGSRLRPANRERRHAGAQAAPDILRAVASASRGGRKKKESTRRPPPAGQDTIKDRIAGDPCAMMCVDGFDPQEIPKFYGNTPSVPDPASCAVFSMDSVLPGANAEGVTGGDSPHPMRSFATGPSHPRVSELATRS